MTSCLLSCISTVYSEKGSTLNGENLLQLKGSVLKRKNLFPWGANSFLLEQNPFQKGGKINSDRIASPERLSISTPLKQISLDRLKKCVSQHRILFLYLIITKCLSQHNIFMFNNDFW